MGLDEDWAEDPTHTFSDREKRNLEETRLMFSWIQPMAMLTVLIIMMAIADSAGRIFG